MDGCEKSRAWEKKERLEKKSATRDKGETHRKKKACFLGRSWPYKTMGRDLVRMYLYQRKLRSLNAISKSYRGSSIGKSRKRVCRKGEKTSGEERIIPYENVVDGFRL